ncbi:MAG TPA: alpha/beta hydrolase [Acidimicrobiia bacterium]|jgi:pimeloyl-ACP methyl ester carboxylesterase|nr:alpha/beta hydrolase [Acidimicrobiia bacterium]
MATFANAFGPHAPDATYIAHDLTEQRFDAGEVEINYVRAGDASKPALLLIPGQTESWWGYEAVLPVLAEHFQAFAVDLRGQGRSSRTPGRYTLDLVAGDLVRFIDDVIGRPTIVAGLSSGGVITAWLSAYAKPGQVVGAYYEDPPLFASEVHPAVGQSIRQAIGPIFAVMAKYLGDQWSIGDWDGMVAALPSELPDWMAMLAGGLGIAVGEPPQTLKEYDPEWGRAFWTGTFSEACDHERMLRGVKVPVLFTHHFRMIHETSGALMGASSDLQATRVRDLVTAAGQPFEYVSLPATPHSLHGHDPQLYVDTLRSWVSALPTGGAS